MKALLATTTVIICICASFAVGVPYFVNLAGAICFCIACGVIGTALATDDIKGGYYDDEE